MMTEMEAIRARHSVRQYKSEPLRPEEITELAQEVRACNEASGLRIQMVVNEPRAFSGFMARYGHFSGVTSYFALVGQKGPDLQEKCGYWGERLVLKAQSMGLNTCWVALTFGKVRSAYSVGRGEKLVCVIAVGHGANQGVLHKSRPLDEVAETSGHMPDWFRSGVEAALLAPTALNQQKFRFTLAGDTVSAQAGSGAYAKIDLGIVKYHFELGAGKERFRWG